MAESWGNHIAIVVEGILRMPNDAAPIMQGIMLYKSLVQSHRVSLIIDSAAKEKIQYWLMINGLTEHVKEVYWEDADPEDTANRRAAQVSRLRQDGPLSMIIESNTDCAEKLLNEGIPTFLFLHPQYTHPSFRPDSSTSITPWSELVAEQKRQLEARALDTRLHTF